MARVLLIGGGYWVWQDWLFADDSLLAPKHRLASWKGGNGSSGSPAVVGIQACWIGTRFSPGLRGAAVLSGGQAWAVNDLVARVIIAQPAVFKHLGMLRSVGLW